MVSFNRLSFSTRRALVKVFRVGFPAIDVIGLLALLAFGIHYLPKDILNSMPATGGDMGSHFWPLYTLRHHGLPEFTVRVWNPGNLGGEPHLVHYFPLSFFAMALLSFVPGVSLETAFNVGTILGLIGLPFCAYFCLRGIGAKFPAPLLAASLSLLFLFNESFTMWGGNTLSTLAGQFAHGYALCAFLLATGALTWELRKDKLPFLSSLLFAAVAIGHAYVELVVPFMLLGVLLFFPHQTFIRRLLHCFATGVVSILLSLWFVWPMVDNGPWMTPMPMIWHSKNIWLEIIPQILWPIAVMLVIGIAVLVVVRSIPSARGIKLVREKGALLLVFLVPMLANIAFYFAFPALGLVDVRAVPQIQILSTILVSLFLYGFLRSLGVISCFVLTLPIVFSIIWWTDSHVEKFKGWAEWNYSGWQTKQLYDDVLALSEGIRGDFSDPRVVYEHSQTNNAAGTERVFEMLPYFAGRSTLESLYTQATVLSPASYYMQALVSKRPSCPLTDYPCPKHDLTRVRPYLSLLAVDSMILTSKELLAEARQTPYLREVARSGPWQVFKSVDPISYIDVPKLPPSISDTEDWKAEFFDWFAEYNGTQPYIISLTQSSSSEAKELTRHLVKMNKGVASRCNPSVKVDFNYFTLSTDCPGELHVLKFAYHPSWSASSGDPLYLVSPGFLGVVPSERDVRFDFGQSPSWYLATLLSFLTFIGMTTCFWLVKKKRKEDDDS